MKKIQNIRKKREKDDAYLNGGGGEQGAASSRDSSGMPAMGALNSSNRDAK